MSDQTAPTHYRTHYMTSAGIELVTELLPEGDFTFTLQGDGTETSATLTAHTVKRLAEQLTVQAGIGIGRKEAIMRGHERE